jgi:sugar phosphate permease
MARSLKDSKKSIGLLLMLFVMYALIYMTKNCYSAAMASIVSQGIMTKSETGLIAAAFYIVYAPFQIVGGIAADRFSPYKLIMFGMLGGGLCNLLVYFFSDNYVAMLVIWSVNAILQFGIWPSIFKIITSQLCRKYRTRAVFYMSFSSTLGLIFSYACAAVITDWRFNFLLSAIVLFACVAIFGIAYRIIARSMTADEVADAPVMEKKKREKGILLMILRSGVPMLLIVYAIHGFLNLGLKSLSPVMLIEAYPSLSPAVANALNIILILAGPVGLMLSRLPVFRRLSEPMVMSLMLGVVVPLLLVVTFVGQVHLAVILVSLTVMMVATGLMSVYFSYVSKTFEKYGCGATLAGLFNCMASVGIVLANFVFARIADDFGWGVTTKAWLLTAIGALILCAIAVPIWNRFKKSAEEDN